MPAAYDLEMGDGAETSASSASGQCSLGAGPRVDRVRAALPCSGLPAFERRDCAGARRFGLRPFCIEAALPRASATGPDIAEGEWPAAALSAPDASPEAIPAAGDGMALGADEAARLRGGSQLTSQNGGAGPSAAGRRPARTPGWRACMPTRSLTGRLQFSLWSWPVMGERPGF